VKLSKAQTLAVKACYEAGGLFQEQGNLWRWYRRHENGMVGKVAGNATIETLVASGIMVRVMPGNVTLSPAGRRLANS
jgi:hypothetical protein